MKKPAPVILAGDDPFQMGRNAAFFAGKRIKVVLKVLSRLEKTLPPLLTERLRQDIKNAHPNEQSRKEQPEIKGLAISLGVSEDDILWAKKILQSLASPFCTNFGAVPPAASNQDVLISWNFDAPYILRLLMGEFPLFVRKLKGQIPYLCLGVPGIFGIGILNAGGLSCVVNAVGLQDDGPGLNPFELNNMAMETCSKVEEAVAVFKNNPRQATKALTIGMLMNWNMIWADEYGALSVLEYSHNHFREEKIPSEGFIASANHHQFLDRKLTGSFDPESWPPISGSYSRLARMRSLLKQNSGSIDPLRAKSIVSDHIPDYALLSNFGVRRNWWEDRIDNSTICAHPWNFLNHLRKGEFKQGFLEISMSTTLYSIQIQPKKLTTWFTCGHPCRNTCVPLYWGPYLGAEAEPESATLGVEDFHKPKSAEEKSDIFGKELGPGKAFLKRAWYALVSSVEKRNFKGSS